MVLQVPKGRVTTYKYLAVSIGSHAYRAVGQLLRNNPNAPYIPCHRVVSSNGTIGGFMGAWKGPFIAKKKELLRKEGVTIKGNKLLDFNSIVFSKFY